MQKSFLFIQKFLCLMQKFLCLMQKSFLHMQKSLCLMQRHFCTCKNSIVSRKNHFCTCKGSFVSCKNNFCTCKTYIRTCKNYFWRYRTCVFSIGWWAAKVANSYNEDNRNVHSINELTELATSLSWKPKEKIKTRQTRWLPLARDLRRASPVLYRPDLSLAFFSSSIVHNAQLSILT